MIFFFQAEDGIRDAQESRGLGDVYKRQVCESPDFPWWKVMTERGDVGWAPEKTIMSDEIYSLSLIHI